MVVYISVPRYYNRTIIIDRTRLTNQLQKKRLLQSRIKSHISVYEERHFELTGRKTRQDLLKIVDKYRRYAMKVACCLIVCLKGSNFVFMFLFHRRIFAKRSLGTSKKRKARHKRVRDWFRNCDVNVGYVGTTYKMSNSLRSQRP
jgi:hypothetical protein